MSASKELNTGAKKISSNVQQNVRSFLLKLRIFIFSFLVSFIVSIYLFAPRSEIDNLGYWTKAFFTSKVMHSESGGINYKSADGKKQVLSASTILKKPSVLASLNQLKWHVIYSLAISAFSATVLTLILILGLRKYGKESSSSSKRLRGAELVSEAELIKRINAAGIAGDLQIGSVPIPAGAETQHIYVSGASGCGKGNAIKGVLDAICKRGQRFLVYDKSGEYVSKYYREGTDIILNPFDERMPFWLPWNECETSFDYEMLAASFIPDNPNQKDEHWTNAPRSVLADLLLTLAQQKMCNIDDLFKLSQDKNGLYDFLQGTSSAQILDPDSAEHASSVLSILSPKIKSMRFLNNIESGEYFSLREWVRTDSDRRIFITCSQRQKRSLQPLMTAWIDIAISEILSLPEDRERRIFNIIDELASLDPVNSIYDGLNEGRKFGLCNIISVTSEEAFKEKYGDKKAKTMIGMCSTKVCYRCDEPDNAKWLADLFGEEDVQDAKQSVTLSDRNDSTNLHDQRSKRHILLPTEFMDLPDMTAILKLGRSLPIGKVSVPFKPRPDIAEPMVFKDYDPLKNKSSSHKGQQQDEDPQNYDDYEYVKPDRLAEQPEDLEPLL